MQYVDIEYAIDVATCSRCKFSAEARRFRMTHQYDRIMADGTVKRMEEFDGVYRCPRCGTGAHHAGVDIAKRWCVKAIPRNEAIDKGYRCVDEARPWVKGKHNERQSRVGVRK